MLARLLGYPGTELRSHLPEMRDVLRAEHAIPAGRLAELDALMHALSSSDPLDAEAAYVQLFDRGRATSLHLFEHVHGDSRDRGPAMIDLAQTYEQAGLYLAPGELPDYLPVVLEFVSTQPPREARAFLSEMTHIFNAIFSALQQRQSAYASVIGALLDLAGEKAQPVKVAAEDPLDESLGRAARIRRLLAEGPGQARRTAAHPRRPQRQFGKKEHPHEHAVRISYSAFIRTSP